MLPRRRGSLRADAEEAEVVVVLPERESQERRRRAGLAGGDLHAEGTGVEVDRALEVRDEQDGVVEPDGGDRHGTSFLVEVSINVRRGRAAWPNGHGAGTLTASRLLWPHVDPRRDDRAGHRRHRLHRPAPGARASRGRPHGAGDDPAPGGVRRAGRGRGRRRVRPGQPDRRARRRGRGGLPRALPGLPRLREAGCGGRPGLRQGGRRGRRTPDRLHGRPRRRGPGALAAPALASRGGGTARARPACPPRCCAPRSWSATAASPGSSPASW